MAHPERFGALLFGLALAACGGKSLDTTDSLPVGGSSAQGGSSHLAGSPPSTGGGGNPGGGVAAGASPLGGASTGGREACDGFSDEAGASLAVEIVNDTSQVLHLGSTTATCGTIPLFDVQDDSGAHLTLVADCRSPCALARVDGPIGCDNSCLLPSAIRLYPGETHATTWSGLHFVQSQLPPACVTPPNGAEHCDRAERIEPGKFVFSAIAGSDLDCSATSASGVCNACRPGASACITDGALLSGELHTAVTTLVLDASYGVYPNQAKAAPAPGNPGDAGSTAAPLPVRIIFTP